MAVAAEAENMKAMKNPALIAAWGLEFRV